MTGIMLAGVSLYLIYFTHAPWWLSVFVVTGVVGDILRAVFAVAYDEGAKNGDRTD